ncbi:MAG: DUF4038 domain-containing protein [Saprospiraceae bacterium]
MAKTGLLISIFLSVVLSARCDTAIWSKLELTFTSTKVYDNPIYDVNSFTATFSSPTGRQHQINGFWDGAQTFRIRFSPDELGTWTYETSCSDKENSGLHQQKGTFVCVPNTNQLAIYQKGHLRRSRGAYHLTYDDGTPFFYTACTAWNGALKSTDAEWETYLAQRAANHYNVIQFVTTQWRGCEKDQKGEVAFTGSGRITLNPAFFQRMDGKVDQINAHGLIAAPVLLWALPFGNGRHLSPGYYLPEAEAILLAKYLVARYGGNQVIWILGGDGKYIDTFEQRWKNIGRAVFEGAHPGIVAQHPQGTSWIGDTYKDENWLDIVGYQSSHSNGEKTVNWINKGPMAQQWDKLPPRPLINLEPNYEEIYFRISVEDVRNASYWSIFATPISGITYGANGIWPWIQKEGELIENHNNPGGKGPSTWEKSIAFPGSIQIGYLSAFIQQFQWWQLKPALELLTHQPGDEVFNHFISVVANDDRSTILVYTPKQQEIKIRNTRGLTYKAKWFDPIQNRYLEGKIVEADQVMVLTPPLAQDFVLVLEEG